VPKAIRPPRLLAAANLPGLTRSTVTFLRWELAVIPLPSQIPPTVIEAAGRPGS
jgi:hypothetical protein